MGEDILGSRKEKIISYFRSKPTLFIAVVLAFLAGLGFYIRTKSLPLLIDVTTGDYIPSDPDAMGILRYVHYLIDHGQLMAVDYMRYYPFGFANMEEFSVLTHLIVWFYKIFHFFFSSVTVNYADVVYPAFAFVVALLFFYLFVEKMFDWKVALLASGFLTVLPAYLFRTLAGVSDKEAMAMIFFYAGLYFFLAFFLEKSLWKGIVYSILGGIAVGILWCLWGGIVFVTATIGSFVFLILLLGKLHERQLWLYGLFLAVTVGFLALFFTIRAAPSSLLTSPTSAILFLPLAVGILHHFFYTKDLFAFKKQYSKIPLAPIFVSFGLIFGVALLLLLALYGVSFFTDRVGNLYTDLIAPFSRNRWALTVAESHQPYFTDWVGQFSWRYFFLVFGGAVLLFYETFKKLGARAYALAGAYTFLILAIALNRYSASAVTFNGESQFSIVLYIGGVLLVLLYLLYFFIDLYRKHHESYEELFVHFPYGYFFMSLFFIFLLIGARSAIRLLFVFAPGTAILAAFFVFVLIAYAQKIPTKALRYGGIFVLVVFTAILLNAFTTSVVAQASYSGPSYTQQWQYAMDWVRENTPEDAVFAHWWDYGYFVQTGGERATLSDGGNANPTINYLTGRYLLTGGNDTDALQMLGSRNATHVVVVSDEVAKYGAFSAIGSDANYDRYSWISSYSLDLSQSSQENGTTGLFYKGGSVLDDPFSYQGTEFPAYSAAVAGFVIPMKTDAENNFQGFEDPSAIVYYGGAYYTMPLHCVFLGDREYIFDPDEGEFEGLDACFQIIPLYENGQVTGIGAGLYLSHDVWHTWFTEHYLFGKDTEYFTTVYDDSDSVPLAIYNGRLIGPLKIWEVHYPDDLVIGDEFYITELPEGVNTVNTALQ